jgi:hypothetical protein
MIFRGWSASEKNFSLSFPERQGKGERTALPRRLSSFGAVAATGSAIAASFLGAARDRQEQRSLAPGERADKV